MKVVSVDTSLLNRGLDLYHSRPDKDWGLTDCISFVVMREQNLIDALTADRHFVQAGFRALLL
jgi:predicted nucleic acid-binding protein